MERDDRERLYRQIADRYAQADGERLLRELDALEKIGELRVTPRLDRKVRAIPHRARRRRYTRTAGLLAACLALVLLAPQLLRYSRPGETAAPEAAVETEPEETVADELDEWELETAPPRETGEAQTPSIGDTGEFAVIPLSFSLPDNLTLIGIEQDNAQSIYFLSDQLRDDVVLTMEYADDLPDTAGLVRIDIGDTATYGASTGDYSLLTFLDGGILYTLTCRHDINTLLSLGRHIL